MRAVSRCSRAVALAAVLTPLVTSMAVAQRRAAAGLQPIPARGAARLAPVGRAYPQQAAQPAAATTTGPEWSAFAGIASGDDEYDLGIALGGSAKWRRSDWPVAIRGDAYFAHHSGDFATQLGGFDISLNLFGVMGNAEYSFPIQSTLKPYVFGGIGIFYANADIDGDGGAFDDTGYDSSTDLGFGVGGGVRFTPRFGAELRLLDAGGFTTIPIVAVLHF